MRTVGLSTYRWNNNFRSILILCLYPLILIGMAWVIAYFLTLVSHPMPPQMDAATYAKALLDPTTQAIKQYSPFIGGFVFIWFTFAWFFNTQLMRSLARSHPVTRTEEPELYNLLENLCISRGLPMPQLDIIETHARNAFASGIDERSFRITVTRGLMTALTKDELEAVLAHELSHIMNRDVRLLVITVIFAGLFGFLCQLAWTLFRGSLRMPAGRDGQKGKLAMIVITLGLALILSVGYFATLWSRFALSRQREYDADAGAIELTKNPDAMMRALLRISDRAQIPNGRADVMLMCIENNQPFMGLFATHPPIASRINAISTVTSTPIPTLKPSQPAQPEERFNPTPTRPPVNPWNVAQRRNPWA